MFSIPILTYHKISYQKEFGLTTLSPDLFKLQLEILKNHSYCTRIFKELTRGPILSERNVILTFDDGYDSVYDYAFPLMRDLNMSGVVFVVTDFINKKNEWESYPLLRKFRHLNKEQLLELQRAGFEIGSHGRRHLYLNNKPDRVLKTELEDSKKVIEDLTGSEVISFCYPFGRCNKRVAEFARQAGYKYAVCNATLFRNPENDPWQLRRHTVYSTDRTGGFLKKARRPDSHRGCFVTEWIIQQGALPNIIRQNMNKYD